MSYLSTVLEKLAKFFRGILFWRSRYTVLMGTLLLLLLSCAKSHMLSASPRQPRLLHVSAVDRRQTWSMDKSWRCVTLSGFLHSHIVRCRWNPISCGTHYSGPGLSKNDSAVTTDVCEDQNREVGFGVYHQSGIDHRSRLPVFPPPTCDINWLQVPPI